MLNKRILAIFIAILLVISNLNLVFGINAGKLNKTSEWAMKAGSIAQTESGITLSGEGTGKLFQTYYNDAFASLDGFHITLNLESLGSVNASGHDSNFGIFLSEQKTDNYVWDANNKGMFLLFQPFAANTDINAFWVNALVNAGNIAATSIGDNYLEINKNKGSVDVLLMKDGNGNWHMFINGKDRGIDLGAVKSVLDTGNLYFGIAANENGTSSNNYSVKLSQINGTALGSSKEFDENNFIKSTKTYVAANQNIVGKENGVELSGTLNNVGLNFKYGLNKTYKDLNGFNTTINTTMDGENNVNGVASSFAFGLSTIGDGTINSDRLDVWDYINNPVNGARGIQIRLTKNGSTYSSLILALGTNNQLDIPADAINGSPIDIPTDGIINFSFITTNNGGISHWSVLVNGRAIISDNALVNAELDKLSQIGACPSYLASYDNKGNLTTASAKMLLLNIGGTLYMTTPDTTDTTNTVISNKQVTDNDFLYSGINSKATYVITDSGLKVSATAGQNGFLSMLTYVTPLNTNELGITLKYDKVFASTPANPHHIDIILGNKKDANFIEQKCLYLRLTTKGNSVTDGLTAKIILNTTGTVAGLVDPNITFDIPVISDGNVVVKLIKIDGVYRLYINGIRCNMSALDAQIIDLLDVKLGGKVYLETVSSWDGITNQKTPTVFYLYAVNKQKFVRVIENVDTKNTIKSVKHINDSDFIYSGINTKATYTITDKGLRVSAIAGQNGFQSMVTYLTPLNANNLGITLKYEKVFASTPANPHHIDIILGNKKDANFTEQECLYLRLTTKGNSVTNGLTAKLVLNTTGTVSGLLDPNTFLDIPVNSDGNVVVKLIKYKGFYRLYINDVKFNMASLDAKLLDLLDVKLGGKVYLEAVSSWDGITDQKTPTVYYINAVNGQRFAPDANKNPNTSDTTNFSFIIILLASGIFILSINKKKHLIEMC